MLKLTFLNANLTKWSNTLNSSPFADELLSVFHHIVGLASKRLIPNSLAPGVRLKVIRNVGPIKRQTCYQIETNQLISRAEQIH